MNRGIVNASIFSLLTSILNAVAWGHATLPSGAGYTNLAGKVIVATPVKVEDGRVWFGRQAVPMKVFPVSEQKRIKEAVGIREVPSELKGLAAEIASQRARVEARTKAGRMTAEALAEYRHGLAVSWEHAVETSNLNAEEKNYWKGKCP